MLNSKARTSHRSYRLGLVGLTVLLVLLLVQGCSTKAADTQAQGGADTATVRLDPAPQVGHPAPDFTLKGLDGNQFRLSDLRGKVVFINFWATWCPPCRAEMPEMQAVYQKHKNDGVVIVGVDIAEPDIIVRETVRQGGYGWTFVLDSTGMVANDYQVTGIPTSLFLDREGIIRSMNVGAMSRPQIESALAMIR